MESDESKIIYQDAYLKAKLEREFEVLRPPNFFGSPWGVLIPFLIVTLLWIYVAGLEPDRQVSFLTHVTIWFIAFGTAGFQYQNYQTNKRIDALRKLVTETNPQGLSDVDSAAEQPVQQS